MTFFDRFYRSLSDFIPEKKKKSAVYNALTYSGHRVDFDIWLGKRIFLIGLLGVIGFLLPWTVGKTFGFFNFEKTANIIIGDFAILIFTEPLFVSIVLSMAMAGITTALLYLHIYYKIESRTAIVESVLPDFLMLVSSNVSAGMTPFAAFRAAARKEFGPLSEEIKVATAKALGTQSFTEALLNLKNRIKSSQLEETVSFFGQSLRSGGKLSALLETSANYLRDIQEMRKELLATTKMYVLFVAFVVVIGTPLLMAISVQFLVMVTNIQAQSSFDSSGSPVGFLSSQLNITPEFMEMAALLLFFINALLSSLFIGVLNKGKAKLGLINFPLIFIATVIVFFIARTVFSQFLSF